MVRAFSDAEKESIRQKLLSVGDELFSRFGLKKTSVDEIAAKAGISKGSFYSFYKSKELLLWDVINNLEKQVRIKFYSMLAKDRLDREDIRKLLFSVFTVVDEYPLIKMLLNGEEYQLLQRNLPPEIIDEHVMEDYDFANSFISGIAEMGFRLPGSPEAAGAMLRSLFFITLHRREIGKGYEEGMELLCSIIADSFVSEGGDR